MGRLKKVQRWKHIEVDNLEILALLTKLQGVNCDKEREAYSWIHVAVFACLIAASAGFTIYCRPGYQPSKEHLQPCYGPGAPKAMGHVVGYPFPGPGNYPTHRGSGLRIVGYRPGFSGSSYRPGNSHYYGYALVG